MVRTQRLWQTHYPKKKKETKEKDAHKSQPQSLILPHTIATSISHSSHTQSQS
jgi:hypothetical protein